MKEDKKLEKRKNIEIVALGVIIVALLGLCIYLLLIKKDDKPIDNNSGNNQANSNEKEYNNTFVYENSGSYGIAYVKGYVKIVKEPYCGEALECTEKNTTSIENKVLFYVVNTESDALKKEIDSWYGKGYTGEKSIQLGCLDNDIISYYNAADDFYNSANTGVDDKNNSDNYNKKFSLDKDVSRKIINSNQNKMITLKLEKLKLTHGGHAFSCFSPFSGIEVVE